MAQKKILTSQKGRKCKQEDCVHVLSIYNHEAYCRVHWDRKQKKTLSAGAEK